MTRCQASWQGRWSPGPFAVWRGDLSDLFYLHFERFGEHFSVITFDYQERFATIDDLADAVAEALGQLGVRARLVGQSPGVVPQAP